MKNLFSSLPASLPEEAVDLLVDSDSVRIERIVSTGHKSDAGFWYDQAENEFVIVLKGKAVMRFAGEAQEITMGPGDFLNIPAHQKHRVESTCANEPTVWLAVFYS